MAATALLSTLNSNTSTALIMMPMGLAMLRAGGIEEGIARVADLAKLASVGAFRSHGIGR